MRARKWQRHRPARTAAGMASSGDLFGDGSAARKLVEPAAAQPAKKKPALAPVPQGTPGEAGYTAASIEVLGGLEPVRRRPGMYIGGTDEKALHHLFAEVIDNSMDEAVAGHATFIDVSSCRGRLLTVTDNGRGIPVDPHPKFPDKSALEVIMTTLHAGGKFDSKVYETSGGLHGVGVSVVNALSDLLEVEVARGQQLYRQTFSRGIPQGAARDARRGAQPARHEDALPPRRADLRRGSAGFPPAPLQDGALQGLPLRRRRDPLGLRAFAAEGQDGVRPRRRFRFPAGLKDYLAREIEGRELVTETDLLRQDREARRPRLARMGGRLAGRRG